MLASMDIYLEDSEIGPLPQTLYKNSESYDLTV